jgi:hypothetical protein
MGWGERECEKSRRETGREEKNKDSPILCFNSCVFSTRTEHLSTPLLFSSSLLLFSLPRSFLPPSSWAPEELQDTMRSEFGPFEILVLTQEVQNFRAVSISERGSKRKEEEEEEEEEGVLQKQKTMMRRTAFWVVSLTTPSHRQGVHRLAFLGGHCSKVTILRDGLLVVVVELAQEANFLVRFPTMRTSIICVPPKQTRRASPSRELVYELVYGYTHAVAYARMHKHTCTPTHARTHAHMQARACVHPHAHTHVRACMRACVCVRVCACVGVQVCLCTYTPTHTHLRGSCMKRISFSCSLRAFSSSERGGGDQSVCPASRIHAFIFSSSSIVSSCTISRIFLFVISFSVRPCEVKTSLSNRSSSASRSNLFHSVSSRGFTPRDDPSAPPPSPPPRPSPFVDMGLSALV